MKRLNHSFITRFIYIVLLVAAGVLVSNVGGAFTYVVFYTLVLYTPITLLWLVYERFALRIFQDVDVRLLYKNKPEPYTLSLSNAGILPIAGVTFAKDDEITRFKEDLTDIEYSLLPGETVNISTEISCRYAGGYVAGLTRITITDCFGIFKISYNTPSPLRVYVLPAITDIANNDINKILDNNLSRNNLYKLDSEEITLGNDIRPYRVGDSISHIHWKNYARTGRLFTRLYDKQESDMMNLFVVPDVNATIESKDYMLDYVVSVANCFAKIKKPVRIFYYCAGVRDIMIDGYETFRKFYPDRLNEFGSVGGDVDPSAEKKLIEASLKIDGTVLYYYENEKTLKV